MWPLIYWVLMVIFEGPNYASANDKVTCNSQLNVLKLFIFPENYENDEIPLIESGKKPFVITVDMEIWDITDLSLEKQDMGVDLILSITWRDPRLTVHPNITSPRLWHMVSKEEARFLWRPILLYRNCKGCLPITLDSSSMSPLYMRKTDGLFWVQERSLIRFRCSIDLRFYPMDRQECWLQLYTNVDHIEGLVLEHAKKEEYSSISSNMTLSEFTISKARRTGCNFNKGNGTMSCLEIRIHFDRLLAYHLMTSYIPTTFIVIISWISFWIPVDAVPARIALGLTLLLTMATRLDQAQKNLPSVSYVKAIDVWIFACICMVCCSLLEYAVSHYVWRVYQMGSVVDSSVKYDLNTRIKVRRIGVKSISDASQSLPKKQQKQRDGTSLDRASRVVFPGFFLLFSLIYWIYYL